MSCVQYQILYVLPICNPRMEQRKLCFGKGFHAGMADSALTYWNVLKKLYRDGDPSLSMVSCECTCIFHWWASLDKVTQKYIKPSLLFQHKKFTRITRLPCDERCSVQTMMSFVHDGCLHVSCSSFFLLLSIVTS